jgi:hypothetical protein
MRHEQSKRPWNSYRTSGLTRTFDVEVQNAQNRQCRDSRWALRPRVSKVSLNSELLPPDVSDFLNTNVHSMHVNIVGNLTLCGLVVCYRQGLKPVNHAQQNAEAVKAQSLANQRRKEEEHQKAARAQRPVSAVSTRVRSSGYGTPDYQPRCALAR